MSYASASAGLGPDPRAALLRIERLARLLDSAVVIPGTGVRLGADALIGLLPGIGDAATAALSLYIIFEAGRLGVPSHKIARMVGNVVFDTVAGAIPIVGDLVDVAWRSNMRNLAILKEHLGQV